MITFEQFRGLNNARRPSAAGLQIDPHGILDLRPGLNYKIVDRAGDLMSDGYRVPTTPDGMGCFQSGSGSLILMRNHELATESRDGAYLGSMGQPYEAYDEYTFGCVTRVVIDKNTLKPSYSNLALAGTLRNCAGGVSPYGWFTCEEPPPELMWPKPKAVLAQKHGYVFLTSHLTSGITKPKPLICYGRFRHEALAFDPATGIAYLTEDQPHGCFYRLWPKHQTTPFEGKLQALAVVGKPKIDLSNEVTRSIGLGEDLACHWVDVDNLDPPTGEHIAFGARNKGAARFVRGEGAWFHGDFIYFACTSGGPKGTGQIFRYRATGETGTLRLMIEGDEQNLLNMPDNLTITPWSHLLIAEDNYSDARDHIIGVSPKGQMYVLARNVADTSEFAGLCMSPDGLVLFANIQQTGLTVGIYGAFPKEQRQL